LGWGKEGEQDDFLAVVGGKRQRSTGGGESIRDGGFWERILVEHKVLQIREERILLPEGVGGVVFSLQGWGKRRSEHVKEKKGEAVHYKKKSRGLQGKKEGTF